MKIDVSHNFDSIMSSVRRQVEEKWKELGQVAEEEGLLVGGDGGEAGHVGSPCRTQGGVHDSALQNGPRDQELATSPEIPRPARTARARQRGSIRPSALTLASRAGAAEGSPLPPEKRSA